MSNQILGFRCRECRLNLISSLPLHGKLPHKQPKTSWQSKKPNSDQWPLYRRRFYRGTSLSEGVYQSLWPIQWRKHWPTEEDRTKLMRRGESRILTKRIVNLVSTIRNRMINRGHDTLSCSIQACCLSDAENAVTISSFFLFSLISMSLKHVWDLYIFVCYNLSASVHSKITAFEFKLFIDSIKSR